MTTIAPRNIALLIAKKEKNDEFYTGYNDIEKELSHYWDDLQGTAVYNNCDNPYNSNFFKYLVINFNRIGLKRLVATSFASRHGGETPYKATVTFVPEQVADQDPTAPLDVDKLLSYPGNELVALAGDGSFLSDESLDVLEESDVVITNPPFSKFRAFFSQLVEYEKKFIVIGNMNASTTNSVFPQFKNKKVWYGKSGNRGNMEFQVPKDYPIRTKNFRNDDEGNLYLNVNGIRWFTNVGDGPVRPFLELTAEYVGNEEYYPEYNNHKAINVDRMKDIPKDYEGPMGVPITFFDKWNHDQFDVLDAIGPAIGDREVYKRIVIQKVSDDDRPRVS